MLAKRGVTSHGELAQSLAERLEGSAHTMGLDALCTYSQARGMCIASNFERLESLLEGRSSVLLNWARFCGPS